MRLNRLSAGQEHSAPRRDRNPWRLCACGREYNATARDCVNPRRCNACNDRIGEQQLAAIRQAGRA